MKTGIHPEYKTATVTCSCGNSFETGSVKKTSTLSFAQNVIHSILDAKKFAAADGRVDRFNKKYGLKEEINN